MDDIVTQMMGLLPHDTYRGWVKEQLENMVKMASFEPEPWNTIPELVEKLDMIGTFGEVSMDIPLMHAKDALMAYHAKYGDIDI